MSIIYCGDIHGRSKDLYCIVQAAENKGCKHIIQVGDFGLFWPTTNAVKRFNRNGRLLTWRTSEIDQWITKRAKRGKWTAEILTCGGNHDNWNAYYELWEEQGRPDKIEVCEGSGVYWVARGAQFDIQGISHLFLGGAESTDQHHRTPDLSWWDREEPNKEEFGRFFDNLEDNRPDTVVTHDVPLRIEFDRMRRNSSVTPNMLENTLKHSKHRPRAWYYGHHHDLRKDKVKGTKFFGCGLHGQYWERELDDLGGAIHKEED